MISIYALINPIDESVFYIGASRYPKSRLRNHYSEKGTSYKCKMVSEIKKAGHKPEMVILDEVEQDKISFFEDFYIDLFKSYGFPIKQSASTYKDGHVENKGKLHTSKENIPYPIRLQELYEPIKEYAVKNQRSMNWVIKTACRDFLSSHKDEYDLAAVELGSFD